MLSCFLETFVNKNLFELIKLLISAQPHQIYHQYIRVLYMPWRCLLVWTFILMYEGVLISPYHDQEGNKLQWPYSGFIKHTPHEAQYAC